MVQKIIEIILWVLDLQHQSDSNVEETFLKIDKYFAFSNLRFSHMIKLLGLAMLLFASNISCGDNHLINNEHSAQLVQPKTDSILPIETRYQVLKDSVSTLRKIYKAQYQQSINKTEVIKLARASFIKLLEKDFFTIWNGTQWDFYGTTQVPQKGKIACGYFVTTVLRDMGVKIDRVNVQIFLWHYKSTMIQ